MSHNCILCKKRVTYDYKDEEKPKALHDFFQVLAEYICDECVKKIIEKCTYTEKVGRKRIREIIKFRRPTYKAGDTI